MKFAVYFSIAVRGLMFAQWAFFLASGRVPQLNSEPWEITFHMAAEFLTACALLVGGIGTIERLPWGQLILLAGLGIMIYSVFNSPGYFAQSGDWALVGMFLVLLLLGVFSVFKLMKSEPTSRTG